MYIKPLENSINIPDTSDGRGEPAHAGGFPDGVKGSGSGANAPVLDVDALLGTITNLTSSQSQNQPEQPPKKATLFNEIIKRRFKLQNQARKIFLSNGMYKERINWCLRQLASSNEFSTSDNPYVEVHISTNPDERRSHYSNLMRCGSVWSCPLCAAKISEERRVELAELLARARERMHKTFMLTYTLRHNLGDDLVDLLDRLKKAVSWFKTGDWWVKLRDKWGYVGSVKASEVTFGRKNGWHPHIHELVFFTNPELDMDEIERTLKARWAKCAQKFGFDASWEHGLDIGFTDGAAEGYISKFGLDDGWNETHELAKQVSKIGRGSDSVTPFQMLELSADGGLMPDGSDPAKRFLEYYAAFKGRSQLRWSKGLRDYYGMGEELPDEEAVEESGGESRLFAVLDTLEWGRVLRTRTRAQLLSICSTGSYVMYTQFMDEIKRRDKLLDKSMYDKFGGEYV